jgi:hypothetical protein
MLVLNLSLKRFSSAVDLDVGFADIDNLQLSRASSSNL